MIADFSGTIARLGGQTITVTRRAQGIFVNGRYVPGTASTITVENCSVQPLNDRELQNLPEGHRTKDMLKLYTPEVLQVAKDPDHVTYEGTEFEVQAMANWRPQGNYHRYLLVEVED